MAQRKQGPFTAAEIQQIWQGSVPERYWRPLVEAGEGQGLEVYTQSFQQWQRVSQAIDTSLQAMYVLPWSGQTAPPAAFAQPAAVTLTFTRVAAFEVLLLLAAGQVVALEQAYDYGDPSGEQVLTGRRYVLSEDLVFLPGEAGPLTVTAVSDAPGFGYNNPLPGSLSAIEQPGNDYSNGGASVTSSYGSNPAPPTAQAFLVTANEADTLLPTHVGQYAQILSAPSGDAGQIFRIASFLPPSGPNGSSGQIDILACATIFSPSGPAFQVGEVVSFSANSGLGVVLAARADAAGHLKVAFRVTFENGINTTLTMTGLSSGASGVVSQLAVHHKWNNDAGGVSWRILDWAADLGLRVTNALSPEGGVAGMLEMLGKEKGVYPAPMEPQEDFRDRVAKLADVVSPNAEKRALNRTLGKRGLPWCYREVGDLLQGIFYDRTDSGGDSYDLDTLILHATSGSVAFMPDEPVEYRDAAGNVLLRGWVGKGLSALLNRSVYVVPRDTIQGLMPASPNAGDVLVGLYSGTTFAPTSFVATIPQPRFQVNLDYADFRGFFLVGVPNLNLGEFGFAYDAGPSGAFDCAPFLAFFDGFPVGGSQIWRQVWQVMNTIKAGGVGFDLYLLEGEPCA